MMTFGSLLATCWSAVATLWWRWRLSQAETELGRAGWQSCDFGGEARDLLNRLDTTERHQLDLINQRATCATALAELDALIASAIAARDSAAAMLQKVRDRQRNEGGALETALAAARTKTVRFQNAISALEEELAGKRHDNVPPRPKWQVHIELVEAAARLQEEKK